MMSFFLQLVNCKEMVFSNLLKIKHFMRLKKFTFRFISLGTFYRFRKIGRYVFSNFLNCILDTTCVKKQLETNNQKVLVFADNCQVFENQGRYQNRDRT